MKTVVLNDKARYGQVSFECWKKPEYPGHHFGLLTCTCVFMLLSTSRRDKVDLEWNEELDLLRLSCHVT